MKEFVEKLSDYLTIADVDDLCEDTLLESMGLRSIDVVSLLSLFDDEYGKDITLDEIKACLTLGDLYNLTK